MSTHAKRPLPGSSSAQDEADADDGPCSSSSPPDAKRARYSSASAEQAGSLAQQQQQLLTQDLVCLQQQSLCLQVPRFRHTQQVVRPGVPHPIDLAHFKLVDKPSPPLREDDKVPWLNLPAASGPAQHGFIVNNHFPAFLMCLQEGHYNYELGENISSRCE